MRIKKKTEWKSISQSSQWHCGFHRAISPLAVIFELFTWLNRFCSLWTSQRFQSRCRDLHLQLQKLNTKYMSRLNIYFPFANRLYLRSRTDRSLLACNMFLFDWNLNSIYSVPSIDCVRLLIWNTYSVRILKRQQTLFQFKCILFGDACGEVIGLTHTIGLYK